VSQIDDSSENVLSEWRRAQPEQAEPDHDGGQEEDGAWGAATEAPAETEEAEVADAAADDVPEPELPQPGGTEAIAVEPSQEHAAGELKIPDGYAVLEGDAHGSRRAVGVVVARFNGGVTSRLLSRALEELDTAEVRRDAITVLVVPGAFELPLAATALAKTRRFACIVALGCVIRGETPHFEYVAGETASGLQLAALETGVPVSFGVLTVDDLAQADARVEKGAEAVRTALEMADVFAHLRAAASASR
jgi:6,7-dimethyl-8-ribityllumazine synthase